jgi:hypothetical protein
MSLLAHCGSTAATMAVIIAATTAEGAPKVNVPEADTILSTLKTEHPRLLVSREGFQRLRQRVQTDSQLKAWYEALQREAEKTLAAPPSKYEIPDGKRLLATSRRVLGRVSALALLYRLDERPEYLERAWTELEAAAAFKDWNPSHFLDTAEMTAAFALGYDWLYAELGDARRQTLRTAMLEMGLKPGLASYRGEQPYGWWKGARHNWNQVCNGGLIMGALALGDEPPAECREIVKSGLESLKLSMSEFAPDGAWPEGPGYWGYATDYNVMLLASLESALGTDFGFSGYEGFSETGTFPTYISGPFGRSFNFADAGEGTVRAPQLFWLATKFGRPLYAWYQQQVARPEPLDLVWFPEAASAVDINAFPLDRYFRGTEVVSMRSAWGDKSAVFVGFKAGSNSANHSNLDLGSFVLDALGQRWIVDLGADNYNLPGYFGGQRWTYYRMRAESHNTLVLNPGTEADQGPKAVAKIVRFESKPERAFAIADLTPAYKTHATSVRRGVALLDRGAVLIQDEVQTEKPTEVWSFLHTLAAVELSDDGRTATLVLMDAKLKAELLSPPGAAFEVLDARPLPTSPDPKGQKDNKGIRKLAVHVSGATELRLAVLLTPADGKPRAVSAAELRPLQDW